MNEIDPRWKVLKAIATDTERYFLSIAEEHDLSLAEMTWVLLRLQDTAQSFAAESVAEEREQGRSRLSRRLLRVLARTAGVTRRKRKP